MLTIKLTKQNEAYAVHFLIYLIVFLTSTASLIYVFIEGSVLTNLIYANLTGSFVILLSCLLFNTFNMNDPYWSLQTVFNSFYFLINCSNPFSARTLILIVLVNTWAVRLITHLFVSNVHDIFAEDWRYTSFRVKFQHRLSYFAFGFVSFMLIPTLIVYFACVPMLFAFNSITPLNVLDLAAFLLTVTGICFESVADYQMFCLRDESLRRKSKNLHCMDTGLWSLCRHPNYFGEIMFWFGVFVFGLASNLNLISNKFYLMSFLFGVFGVFLIIYFGSMPLMEQRQIKRRAEFYKDYMKRVPFKILPLNFF